jgi:hypothetical protein
VPVLPNFVRDEIVEVDCADLVELFSEEHRLFEVPDGAT